VRGRTIIFHDHRDVFEPSRCVRVCVFAWAFERERGRKRSLNFCGVMVCEREMVILMFLNSQDVYVSVRLRF